MGQTKSVLGDLKLVLKLWKSATIFTEISLYKNCTYFLYFLKYPSEVKTAKNKLLPKWSKNDLLAYFHFKLLQSYPEIIKILEFDLSCLKFIKDSRNTIFHFWCEMTILPLVSFLHNFYPLSIFSTCIMKYNIINPINI